MSNTRDPAPALVIFIRFSFVGRGDWLRWRLPGNGSRDPDEIAADLFDDARMQRRFQSFEMLTLPSLLAQTDRDFRTILLTSPTMPDRHLTRLRHLSDRVEGAEVLVSDADDVMTALAPTIAALHQRHAHLVQIRLDDDDALSVNFIARLRQNAARMRTFPHYALSFSKGLILQNWDDLPPELLQIDQAFMSVGTAARLPEGITIFHHNHNALPKHYPGLQDGRQVSFLYQRWSSSDNDRVPGVKRRLEKALPPAQLARVIEKEFPFLADADLSSLQLRPQSARA